MQIAINNLAPAGLVRLLDSRPFPRFYLDIAGGPCYVVTPRRKELKEVYCVCRLPRFSVSGVDAEALRRAFAVRGYRMF